VRINRSAYLNNLDDLLAIVRPGLEGIFISKPNGPEDVHTASSMIAEAESRNGLAFETVRLIPLLESARSMRLCFEIAEIPRVAALVGSAGKNGDSACAVPRLVAGPPRSVIRQVPCGDGGAGGRKVTNRRLVASGKGPRRPGRSVPARPATLHVGRAYLAPRAGRSSLPGLSPTAEEIAYYRGMIEALEKAQTGGRASVLYEGEKIDIAHVNTARTMIELAEEFGC